ncbi:MAG TPA: phosphate--acyl-ACP acyltransferase, partial [Firmicutes bacterium]|nr:phosphate--acyl-ACP acyltransferase [Bacillota bacterium]
GLREMKKNMDYRETGGAILLGVKKVAVKSHGNSNAYAFYNALKLAYSTVKSGAVSAIAKEIAHEG